MIITLHFANYSCIELKISDRLSDLTVIEIAEIFCRLHHVVIQIAIIMIDDCPSYVKIRPRVAMDSTRRRQKSD